MIKATYRSLFFSLLAISSFFAPALKANHCKSFKHNMQLQVADSLGFLVEGTEFWITIEVIQNEDGLITLNIPLINFQTGQVAAVDPYYPSGEINVGIPPAGGYLFTVDGFLSRNYRPADLMPQTIIAASNNGLSPVFSFTQDPATLPLPPAGYMVQVTNAGELQVQCAGTFGNIIPAGPQILMPCSISYMTHKKQKLSKNVKISTGATNVTQFPFPFSADGFRDSHVNDAFDNVVAFAWTDNSMVADQTNGTMNTMVAIGKVDKHGKLKMGDPVQLTNFPANLQCWDTAVAINRTNPNNIVVSYGIIDFEGGLGIPARAVSFDGGQTWPAPLGYNSFTGSITGTTLTVTDITFGSVNIGDIIYTYFATSPTTGIVAGTIITAFGTGTGGIGTYSVNISQNAPSNYIVATPQLNGQTTFEPPYSTGFGDARGVSSDKFGNIWYGASVPSDEFGNFIYASIFAVSTDGGVTFTTIYITPSTPDNAEGDYPQYCFGGDGLGNYGLWFQVSTFDQTPGTGDAYPTVGFIPITGLGSFGTPTITALPGLTNAQLESDITASADGRLWLQAGPWIGGQGPNASPYTYIQPSTIVFKSPGAQDLNYAGPWDFNNSNNNVLQYFGHFYPEPDPLIDTTSYLYFALSVQSIIYDDARQALYALVNPQYPNYSEDMKIFFSISRDNGMTWSDPINVSNTKQGNRGYQSMALDTATGNLLFGWYDGRNDPTYESVEYYGAVLSAKKLNKLVNKIPLSNPTFVVPSAA